MDGLHPSLTHHIVNVLCWAGRHCARSRKRRWNPPRRLRRAAARPHRRRKTEAAVFPLLSAMAAQNRTGLSIVYVCPLKALLNNLLPRLGTYAAWLGRRVALWHGDVSQPRRQAIIADPPDILLTTPESLESMLVSVKVDHDRLFKACTPSSWTRCTRSPATTAAGT